MAIKSGIFLAAGTNEGRKYYDPKNPCVRQRRIAAMKPGESVTFVMEPRNEYDNRAIAVLNQKGEHLGYIPRHRDGCLNPEREIIREALVFGELHAIATPKGDGKKRPIGLEVKYCFKPHPDFVAKVFESDDEAAAIRSCSAEQKPKDFELATKYKGKEFRKNIALGNVERDRGIMRKAGNSKRRATFKRGEDIKPSHLRTDSRYYYYSPLGKWKPFGTFESTLWKEHSPRVNKYISEAEAKERFMERRCG